MLQGVGERDWGVRFARARQSGKVPNDKELQARRWGREKRDQLAGLECIWRERATATAIVWIVEEFKQSLTSLQRAPAA